MADNNPWGQYSLDDQASIRDQFEQLQKSGKLNPAQQKSVSGALANFPQYTPQQFAAQLRPRFGDDPQIKSLDDESLTNAWLERNPTHRALLKRAASTGQVLPDSTKVDSTRDTPKLGLDILNPFGHAANVPIGDYWAGKEGATGDAITGALTGFKNNQEIAEAVTKPGATTAEKIVGRGTIVANNFVASTTSPAGLATMGLGPLVNLARGRYALKARELEESVQLTQALRAGGATVEGTADAAQAVMNARKALEGYKPVVQMARSAQAVVGAGFSAQSAAQSARGGYQAITGNTPQEREQGVEDLLVGGAGAALGGLGVKHSLSPLQRMAPRPVDPARFTDILGKDQGISEHTPDVQDKSGEAFANAAHRSTYADKPMPVTNFDGSSTAKIASNAVQSTTTRVAQVKPLDNTNRTVTGTNWDATTKPQDINHPVPPGPVASAVTPVAPKAPVAAVVDNKITQAHVERENEFFAQARTELGPKASTSAILQRAQALKLADATKAAAPPKGTGWQSVADQKAAGTAKPSPTVVFPKGKFDPGIVTQNQEDVVAKTLSASEKAKLLKPDRSGITDLRTVDPDTRHAWINQNSSGIGYRYGTAAEAAAKTRATFGPDKRFTVNSYLDKDGKLAHAVRLGEVNGEPEYHPSPDPAPAGDSAVSEINGKENQELYASIQDKENYFNTTTNGKHTAVLNHLMSVVEKTLPADASKVSKLALYEKGLRAVNNHLSSGKDFGDMLSVVEKAVGKKGEGGFVSFGKSRMNDEQIRDLANLHVDTTLGRWEKLDDNALANRKTIKTLLDPMFRATVYGANDPSLENRYEALVKRAGGAKYTNPITALGTTLMGHALTGGDFTRDTLREALGTAAMNREQRTQLLSSYRDQWSHRNLQDSISFIDDIEHGDINGIADPQDKQVAQTLRELLDGKRDEIRELGRQMLRSNIKAREESIGRETDPDKQKVMAKENDLDLATLAAGHSMLLDKFYTDYFPHLWEYGIKDMAAGIINGRRPFAPSSFLKPRVYNSFAEGIANGMKPVTYNPIDMALLKLHEMERFQAAHSTFNALKEHDLVRMLGPKEVPDGWTRLNDNMFRAGADKNWYAPADVSRPINNHLSPGLRGNVAYDAVAGFNNVMNQFNLGLSGFHAMETAVNAAISHAGLGIQQLSRGELAGLNKVIASPIKPFDTLLQGHRLMQEYMDPGRFAQMSKLADAVRQAGGRVKLPEEYKNQARQGFRNAWLEMQADPKLSTAAKLAYKTLGAGLEKLSSPLMEWFVPRMKLGAFAAEADSLMTRYGDNPPREMLRHDLATAWDRVDDRFGQVVYDNMFWNRAAKDIAHLAIRSVGWNFGDVRELGGAIWDLKTTPENLKAGRGLTSRQGFALGLLGYTAMIGAVTNAIYGQKVDSPEDLLYPKNGKLNADGSKQRVFLKTYVHDAYGFGAHPVQTGVNKLAPMWHEIADMYRNADYYGDRIHPVHATNSDALLDPKTYTDTGKYLLKEAAPFSLTNYSQRRDQGESIPSALTSGLAILPAPKWVGQTKAGSLSYEFFKSTLRQGPNDTSVSDKIRLYHNLASGYAAGSIPESKIDEAFNKGQLTSQQYNGILNPKENDGALSPLLRHTKGISDKEFLQVWDVANVEEKDAMTPQFYKRYSNVERKDPNNTEILRKFEAVDETLTHKK